MQGKVDLAGLVDQPLVRLRRAASAVRSALSDSPSEFHVQTEHVGLVLLLLVVCATAACAVAGGWRHLALAGVALGSLALLLVGLEATTATGADPRTLVHLPFVSAGLAGLGLEGLRRLPRPHLTVRPGAAVIIVLTLGLTADLNGLFFSTQLVYDRDRPPRPSGDDRLSSSGMGPITVPRASRSSVRPHPNEGPLTPTRDTIGASFFAWDGGNPQRAAAFMGDRRRTGHDPLGVR